MHIIFLKSIFYKRQFIDNDGVISWTEYLSEAFGINPGQEANEILTDPEDMKLMREDRSYFDAADTNHDGKLLKDEFSAFQNPEHYEQMHETLIKVLKHTTYKLITF